MCATVWDGEHEIEVAGELLAVMPAALRFGLFVCVNPEACLCQFDIAAMADAGLLRVVDEATWEYEINRSVGG